MKSLSDGYKNTLSMVADIAYRMAVLNPWLLENVLSETTGIVLIDEVDLHLHPRWQQRILRETRCFRAKTGEHGRKLLFGNAGEERGRPDHG